MNKLFVMYTQLNWLDADTLIEIEYIDLDGAAHSYVGTFVAIMKDVNDGLFKKLQDYEMTSVTMLYIGCCQEWTVRAMLKEIVK